jgi:asparagine synthase (glutamine-hydrolysing)
LGTEHHERSYSIEEVERELSRIIYHLESYDAPLVRSAIACFFLSELAAQHVKVVLTGEGADEVFGGYAYFRDIKNPTALHHECSQLLDGLHGMNLQRVDRMTMAHGLEGRVPFLDVEFIEWTMGIAPDLKLQRPGVPEKQLLRAAASRVLPAEIAWRTKLEFADGAGATNLLADYAESRVSDRDLMGAEKVFPRDPPRTKEELLYRRLFAEHFPGQAAQSTVHRWQPVPSFKRPTTNGAMHGTR